MLQNKSSSAELSEAINSMYRWYRDAEVCFVYLFDVRKPSYADMISGPSKRQFHIAGRAHGNVSEEEVANTAEFLKSSWFTRGWALQELLAPRNIRFFAKDW